MKNLIIATAIHLVVNQTAWCAQKDNRPWPRTAEEALEIIDARVADDDKKWLATLRPCCFSSMHMGWAGILRSTLPIWGNAPLMWNLGNPHPDDASIDLIRRYCRILFVRLPREYQDSVLEFEELLRKTKPTLSKKMSIKEAAVEWTDQLKRRHQELGLKHAPFEIRVIGAKVSSEVWPEIMWQESFAEFFKEEGRKYGFIFYQGDALYIKTREF